MDISVFKFALHKKLSIIYKKYPLIKNKCETYFARAISQAEGKLLLSNEVAKCANTYYEMSTFQKKLY